MPLHIQLPATILKRLQYELRRAGKREIGGLLMGEHLQGEIFRVVDISVQQEGGSAVHFVRDPKHHQEALEHFFEQTGADYTRYNYVGEWHSHPLCEALPSGTDLDMMQALLSDPTIRANFLVLVVVRLARWRGLELSVMLFRPGLPPEEVEVQVEEEPDRPKMPWWRRIWRQFQVSPKQRRERTARRVKLRV